MSAWLDWIYEIAFSRVDTIERELYAHPEHSPKFSEAVRELHAARWTKRRNIPTPP